MAKRDADKNHLSGEQLAKMYADAGFKPEDARKMSSFTHVGPRDGVHLAVANSKRCSRIFVYREADPKLPAIKLYSEQDRKELKLGHIVAEVDFSKEPAAIEATVASLLRAIKAQPAPAPKPEKGAEEPAKA